MKTIIKFLPLLFFSLLFSSCSENIINLDMDDEAVRNAPQDIINPQYVAIDWDQTNLIENDTTTGRVVVELNEYTRNIDKGSVITIIDPNKPGVRIVRNVKSYNDRIQLETIDGDLTNIFANVEFELISTPTGQGRADGISNTFVPYAVAMVGSDGNSEWIKTTIGMDGDMKIPLFNFDDEVISEFEPNGKIWFSKLNANLTFGYSIRFNFGLRREYIDEDIDNAFKMFKSQMVKCVTTTSIGLDSEMVLQGETKGSHTDTLEDELRWHVPITKPLLFNVMGVPVEVSPKIDILRGGKITYEGEAKFTAVARAHTQYTVETTVDMSKNDQLSVVGEYDKPTINYDGTNVSLTGHANMKFWYYPSIKFHIYNFIGPVIDVKPYLAIDANGGFNLTVGNQDRDYMGHQWAAILGFDARMDISLAKWGYETNRVFKTEFKNLGEFDIYRSPFNIEFASATPNKVVAGQSMVVNFEVKDKVLRDEIKTKFPAIVRFTGNGNIAQQYVPIENGRAAAIWTPADENDCLTATLYDGYGKVIASEVFNGEKKDDERLKRIGDIFNFEYDALGRVTTLNDSEFDYVFQYNSDGLESILLDDPGDRVILTDLVFTQDGYIKSFRQVGEDNFTGTGTIDYDSDGHPTKLAMKDSEGFSATSTWEWKDGDLVKMTFKSNEGLNETATFEYSDQDNPLKMWSIVTAGNSMGFLIFTNYMGKGPAHLPTSAKYVTNDDGQKSTYELPVAYGLNASGSIRKESIRVMDSYVVNIDYEYASELDLSEYSVFKTSPKVKNSKTDNSRMFVGSINYLLK